MGVRLEMFDVCLLLVIDSTGSSLRCRVVGVASFVVDVFVEDLLAELVRFEDRRVTVQDVDLFERQAFRLWDREEREQETEYTTSSPVSAKSD